MGRVYTEFGELLAEVDIESFKFIPDSLPSPKYSKDKLAALKNMELTVESPEYSLGSYIVDDSGEIVGHKVSKIVDGEVKEVRLTPVDKWGNHGILQ